MKVLHNKTNEKPRLQGVQSGQEEMTHAAGVERRCVLYFFSQFVEQSHKLPPSEHRVVAKGLSDGVQQ